MLEKNKIAPQRASELTGEFSALAEKLGSSELAELRLTTDGLELSHVRSLPELRRFLQKYTAQVLVNSELRTIHQAYRHSSCAEGRELIALDVSLQKEPLLQNVARASQQVGRAQLKKLRPLRDQRFVQRYLAAVERGEARAWHTIVFGLVLALFSLPLRQGLLHYATQTLNGFIQSAAGRLQLRQTDSEALLAEISQQLPKAVDQIVKGESASLRLVK
jgi:urease accessory protein UreF